METFFERWFKSEYFLEDFSQRHCELQENHKIWNELSILGSLFYIDYTYNSGFNKFLFKHLEPGIKEMKLPGCFTIYDGNGDTESIEIIIELLEERPACHGGKIGKNTFEIYTNYCKDSDTTDEYVYINGCLNSINGRG